MYTFLSRYFVSLLCVLLSFAGPSILAADPVFDKATLTRNSFLFTTGQSAEGASAVLVKTERGVVALTARHLLGAAMGIEPEVSPMRLREELVGWVFFVFVPETDSYQVVANAAELIFPTGDDETKDLLAFLLNEELTELEAGHAEVLQVAQTRPVAGSTYYLVGCPYAEAKCVGNVYPVTFIPNGSYFTFRIDRTDFSLAGFSGAPIVDEQGHLVGILTGADGNTIYAEEITLACVNKGSCSP